MRFAIVVLMLAGTSAAADTEIHRCLLDDGTIAFQETPCSERPADADDSSEADESPGTGETPAPDDDAFNFVNPFDEPAASPTPSQPELPEPVSQDRAECEKTTRDAIDAIDLEIRENPNTKEQREEYLAELLTMTRQLRACKQL
jgi:D-alanyl-D-alanine carboxypeptidase